MRIHIVSAIIVISMMLAACNQDRNQSIQATPNSVEGVSSTSLASVGVDFEQAECRQPSGQGSVDPAMSIFLMIFEINGQELNVAPGEMLPVDPGDEVRLLELTLCVGNDSNSPGEVCVDLAPLSAEGEALSSSHAGTHITGIASGMMTLAGPDTYWEIEDGWDGFLLVVNHWPAGPTEDIDCGAGKCEQDDSLTIYFE